MLVVLLVLVLFAFLIIKLIQSERRNQASPRLTVEAFIVSKRERTTSDYNQTTGLTDTDTIYYLTFEVESGDRMEFRVTWDEYDRLFEGDSGRLSFQGTRYLGFEPVRYLFDENVE